MANLEQLAKLNEGVEAWNRWRVDQASPDLSEANLAGRDLTGADLENANLQRVVLGEAKLRAGTSLLNADLRGAYLRDADLTGANLQDTVLNGAYLLGATLREVNLRGADLSGIKGGIRIEQFAGADLTGAKLPEELKSFYDSLENAKGISESARKIFLAVLAACLYCWLTIATTTDVNLITNRNSSALPIIQTPIPIVGFYVVAPLLLVCVYLYFHFYLQKLWEELGSLPAIFPDGRPLHTKVDPWLLNDLVRSYFPRLKIGRPFLSHLQLWISVLLAWWVVPITMLLFWGRYLRRHDSAGTVFHVVLLVVSLVGAVCFLQLAVTTLRGAERRPFTRKKVLTGRRRLAAVLAVLLGVLFGLVSWGAIWGVPSSAPILGGGSWLPIVSYREFHGPITWVPRFMEFIGYPPFANLTGADVSQKKSNWSGKSEDELDSVVGAQLSGANLRFALARKAFFAGADLTGADLRGAFLILADLSGASLWMSNLGDASLGEANLRGTSLLGGNLTGADLKGAHLNGADLTDADLSDADLSDTDLSGAQLRGAKLNQADLLFSDLRGSENLLPEEVKRALHWDQAFYDDKMFIVLGFSPDHNRILIEQQKERRKKLAEELWRRLNSEQPAPASLSPKQ